MKETMTPKMKKPIKKTYMLKVRMTASEVKIVEGLAAREALTVSAYVRRTLKRLHDASKR